MKRSKFFILLSLVAVLIMSCKKEQTDPAELIDPNANYNLPVVFHVLYQDRNDPLQYVSVERLNQVLADVNKLYKKSVNSVEMNLSFSFASTDPNGREMATPGVRYIDMANDYPIDCLLFMVDDKNNGGKGYVKYLWDPNRYINIMVYNFAAKAESGSNVILGVAHLPLSVTGNHYLEGLTETAYPTLSLSNLAYPHCVSLNSLFTTASGSEDIAITAAHELAHYLGLLHVFFDENPDGTIPSDSKDPDYCPDTESYNRTEYNDYFQYVMFNEPHNFNFEHLSKRKDVNGVQFISTNIMDYEESFTDRFTLDQRKRVRHVLNYSPLIPVKRDGKASRADAPSGVLDLPIRIME